MRITEQLPIPAFTPFVRAHVYSRYMLPPRDSCLAFAIHLNSSLNLQERFGLLGVPHLPAFKGSSSSFECRCLLQKWSLVWLFANVEILQELSPMLKECPAMLQDQAALHSFVTELVHIGSMLICTSTSINITTLKFPSSSDIVVFSLSMGILLNYYLFYNIAFSRLWKDRRF